MIPNVLSPEIKSNAEKNIFTWFKNATGTDDWVVLHSLGIATHQRVIHGETDFLVLAPNYGVFAIEVKGGRVQRTLGKWRFINRYGDYNEKTRGPFDQAWEGIYSIRESIDNLLDNAHSHLKKIVFGIGVMFPDIEYGSVGVDEASWQVFDCNDGKDVVGFIRRIAEGAINTRIRLGYNEKDWVLPSAEDVSYLSSLLRGDFDQAVPLRIKQKYSEETFVTLTQEQSLCVEQLEDNKRALIRGTAGTGKTLLAIETVKRSVSMGEKVAFFCFNRMLGEWLESNFLDYPEDCRPKYVGTFHKYMLHVLVAKGINPEEPNAESLDTYFRKTLPLMVLNAISAGTERYDRIIIDEAQDILEDEYLDVIDMSLKGGLARGHWTMFGDFSMQAIYNEKQSEEEYLNRLQNRAFYALYRLNKNCRNTKKICIDIHNILGIPENSAYDDSLDAPAVEHITYANIEDQTEKLVDVICSLIEKGIHRSDIVILSPRRKEESVVERLQNITVENYDVAGSTQIRFATIHSFKGLESSVIILTDISDYKDERLLYVGLSRARFALYVLETETAMKERTALFFQRRLNNGR